MTRQSGDVKRQYKHRYQDSQVTSRVNTRIATKKQQDGYNQGESNPVQSSR